MRDLTFSLNGYEFNNERSQLIKRTEIKEHDKSSDIKIEMQETVVTGVNIKRPVRIKKDIVESKINETNLDELCFDIEEEQELSFDSEQETTKTQEEQQEQETIEVYRVLESDILKAKESGQPTKLLKSGLSLVKPSKIKINKEDKLETDIIVGKEVRKVRDTSGLFNIIITPQYKIAEFDTGSDKFIDITLPEDIGAIIFTETIDKRGNTLKINNLVLNSSIRYILFQEAKYNSVEIKSIESNVLNQAFIYKHKGVWYYNSTEDITKEVFEAIVLNNKAIKDMNVWDIPERIKDILNYESITLGDPEKQTIMVHNHEFLNKLLEIEKQRQV